MKKIIFVFLAFALYMFAGGAETVFANCSFSSSINDGKISVIASNCTDTDTYVVMITAYGEDDYSFETQKQPSIDGHGFLVDFTPKAGGAYEIKVYQYTTLVYNSTVTVEYQGPLSCGDTCDGRQDDCPAGCPCTYIFEEDLRYCRTAYSTPIPTSTLMPTVPPESMQFGQDPDVYCEGDTGIETALGCIRWGESGFDGLVGFLLKNLMGLVGSVALIMIVYGSFLVMTSSGSPEKIAQGKEIITAAISGLLFAILSIFILRLIGVTWLQLPGLN